MISIAVIFVSFFQELYSIHVSKFPKHTLQVLPCPKCSQIVAENEQTIHLKEHFMNDDFPTLG